MISDSRLMLWVIPGYFSAPHCLLRCHGSRHNPALRPSEHMKARFGSTSNPQSSREGIIHILLIRRLLLRGSPISTSTKALEGDVGLLPVLSALAENVRIVMTSATFIPICCNIIEDVFQGPYLVHNSSSIYFRL